MPKRNSTITKKKSESFSILKMNFMFISSVKVDSFIKSLTAFGVNMPNAWIAGAESVSGLNLHL